MCWEVRENEGLVKARSNDGRASGQELREAKYMVVMAVRTDDNVVLSAIGIQGLIVVQR